MTIKVIYHSSTGNTEKIARAIADAIGVKAETIDDEQIAFTTPIDLLFIGDGIYFGKVNKKTVSFINQLDPHVVKNTAVFATYGGQLGIGTIIKELLLKKGLKVVGEPFTCKGKAWALLNRKHPNESDLEMACEFARITTDKVSR